VDNLPRVLPPGRRAFLKRGSWEMPPVFPWLQQLGNIEQAEMDRVFNCGIGFCLVVSQYFAESIQKQLADDRIKSWVIGEIRDGEVGVEWT
jgi:phosphoribosylformylglycinamidine cyclo-ligase